MASGVIAVSERGKFRKHHGVGMGSVYGMGAVVACSAVLLLWGDGMGYTYPFFSFFVTGLGWLAEGS